MASTGGYSGVPATNVVMVGLAEHIWWSGSFPVVMYSEPVTCPTVCCTLGDKVNGVHVGGLLLDCNGKLPSQSCAGPVVLSEAASCS